MNAEEDQIILNKEETLNALRELIIYYTKMDDQEIIDIYADTFMLIVRGYAEHQSQLPTDAEIEEEIGGYIELHRDSKDLAPLLAQVLGDWLKSRIKENTSK